MTFLLDWKNLLWSIGVLVAAGVLGSIAHRVIFGAARRMMKRTRGQADDLVLKYSIRPTRYIFPLLMMLFVSPGIPLHEDIVHIVRHAIVILLIVTVTWLLVSLLAVIEDLLAGKYRIDIADNLQGRRIKTQVHLLRRVTGSAIMFFGFAVILMTFPTIWNIGAGLFASAGAAGLIIGLAAKPTFSSLLAGIQIALTEPIRLDDVVIVEGEWGRVEEILATYVVVRIWDQRRLVLPLSYFIEHPFQNWTRTSAEIIGTVFLYVDYTVPVAAIRAELKRIVESTDLWDKRVWNLQVTNAKEGSLELRALVSAADSGKAWDLRCLVREQLIGFIREQYPEALPRTRAELKSINSSSLDHTTAPIGAEVHG